MEAQEDMMMIFQDYERSLRMMRSHMAPVRAQAYGSMMRVTHPELHRRLCDEFWGSVVDLAIHATGKRAPVDHVRRMCEVVRLAWLDSLDSPSQNGKYLCDFMWFDDHKRPFWIGFKILISHVSAPRFYLEKTSDVPIKSFTPLSCANSSRLALRTENQELGLTLLPDELIIMAKTKDNLHSFIERLNDWIDGNSYEENTSIKII